MAWEAGFDGEPAVAGAEAEAAAGQAAEAGAGAGEDDEDVLGGLRALMAQFGADGDDD